MLNLLNDMFICVSSELFRFKGGSGGNSLCVRHLDEQGGHCEMASDSCDESFQHVFSTDGTHSGELRRLAEIENEELETMHAESLVQEAEIAAEMDDSQHPVENLFGTEQSVGISFADDSDERLSQPSSSTQGRPHVGAIEGYSAENAFGFARIGLQPEGIKQFWETGFWHDFLDPNRDFLSSFDNNFKRPIDPIHELPEEQSFQLERKPKVIKVAATFMDHVRDTSILNWREQRDAEWQVAIYRWHSMLGTWKSDVKIVDQIFTLDGFQAQAQVLVDIFFNRAPSTILKRCRSMSRMTNYFVDRGRKFPCGEPHVYEFMCVERDGGAPPSRLKGYLEAMTFCRHVLGVSEFEEATVSRRCQGVAAMDVHHKVCQAEPLTVKQLEVLHHVLFHNDELWNRVFAGMLLFCAYARARWSDAQHGEKLIEDMDKSGTCAYLEVATGVHKTAKALQLRHMYLPLVAPCIGVVDGNWGHEWCRCRKQLGIDSLSDFPLMPAPNAEQEPTVRPLSSSEAGSWMRDLLQIDPMNKQVKITSHSLKATCLSFAAKRGCTFEDRLILGYHTHSLKMALVYSRDGASRPLRVLESILKEIRLGAFCPNDTRSGRLRNLQGLGTEVFAVNTADSLGSFEAVSPVNSESVREEQQVAPADVEEHVPSDHATTGSETESAVETTVRARISFKDIEAPEGTVLHQHVKWKTLHLMKLENRVVFLCGRKTGSTYRIAEKRHAFDTPKCRQCFRAKLD